MNGITKMIIYGLLALIFPLIQASYSSTLGFTTACMGLTVLAGFIFIGLAYLFKSFTFNQVLIGILTLIQLAFVVYLFLFCLIIYAINEEYPQPDFWKNFALLCAICLIVCLIIFLFCSAAKDAINESLAFGKVEDWTMMTLQNMRQGAAGIYYGYQNLYHQPYCYYNHYPANIAKI